MKPQCQKRTNFEEGQYDLALKYLKESGKNWYEDDVYFRNVAIACLGITESGKINKTNYKAIISCWLTAVYRDQMTKMSYLQLSMRNKKMQWMLLSI